MNVPSDEGTLDPWVAKWFEANPERAQPFEALSPERLAPGRSAVGPPPTREIATVIDEEVHDIPVRIYEGDGPPTGILVYLHGGGFVTGSIALMDGFARELTHVSGAVVVSVGYRLAPEHPFPAGLDDCEIVTRWAADQAARFGAVPGAVVVSGESAGGNLAAAVTLRLRDSAGPALAGQVLAYPGTAGRVPFPSLDAFDGLVISKKARKAYWDAYSGGRDITRNPFAAPLLAETLTGLPPAMIVLGGCDMLRDEGRAYAQRLRDDRVPVEEVCHPGQPHGFMNFGFPAATTAFEQIGTWVRNIFEHAAP